MARIDPRWAWVMTGMCRLVGLSAPPDGRAGTLLVNRTIARTKNGSLLRYEGQVGMTQAAPLGSHRLSGNANSHGKLQQQRDHQRVSYRRLSPCPTIHEPKRHLFTSSAPYQPQRTGHS